MCINGKGGFGRPFLYRTFVIPEAAQRLSGIH